MELSVKAMFYFVSQRRPLKAMVSGGVFNGIRRIGRVNVANILPPNVATGSIARDLSVNVGAISGGIGGFVPHDLNAIVNGGAAGQQKQQK